MKEKLPYVKWFFSDWIRDTRGLSLEAKGAWIDILSLMHDGEPYGHLAIKGKSRPIEGTARILGTTPKILIPLLAEMEESGLFSKTEDGIIFSRRMVRENHLRKVRGEGGLKGGNPFLKVGGNGFYKDNLPTNLQEETKDNLPTNLQEETKDNLPINLPLVRALECFQSPESRIQNPEKAKTPLTPPLKFSAPDAKKKSAGGKAPPGECLPDFETFWTAYPRKTGKGAASKAWVTLKPPLEACLSTLKWQKNSDQWTKDRGQFIPHPSTWLHQRRWEDERPARDKSWRDMTPAELEDFLGGPHDTV